MSVIEDIINCKSVDEMIEKLAIVLEPKWSKRDIRILSNILFEEYQKSKQQGLNKRFDREYLSKMLIKGKIKNGILPEK